MQCQCKVSYINNAHYNAHFASENGNRIERDIEKPSNTAKEIWGLKREEREVKIQENSESTKQEKVRKLRRIRRRKMAKYEEQNRRWKIIYDYIISLL